MSVKMLPAVSITLVERIALIHSISAPMPVLQGTYHLGGTGSISSNYQYIGYSGTGCFTQSGGSNLIYQTLYLGYNPGSSGTYLLLGGLCGGTFDPKLSEYIGYSGTGTFIQNQGDNLKTEKLFLGYNPSSSGSYTMSGQSRLNDKLRIYRLLRQRFFHPNRRNKYYFPGLQPRLLLRFYGCLSVDQWPAPNAIAILWAKSSAIRELESSRKMAERIQAKKLYQPRL